MQMPDTALHIQNRDNFLNNAVKKGDYFMKYFSYDVLNLNKLWYNIKYIFACFGICCVAQLRYRIPFESDCQKR